MSIITISRGTFSGGKEFAEELAERLGYRCVSREELTEEAIRFKVPVGKLQTAMIKPPRVYQRMGPQRDFYLSCITSLLCKYALEGDIVYHGHTGHLLLSGIPHIFRVRVVANLDYRIAQVMHHLDLSREKALQYIHNIDKDRDKWVRFLYGVDWHNPSYYDLILNLDQVGIANATTALCAMAELPDFKLAPSTIKVLEDLYLANQARFHLALDKRTNYADFRVRATAGVVHVTCMPQYTEVLEHVHDVVSSLAECREVHCTIAGSNILWLGERFDIRSKLFQHVVKVAKKWDAAVELMQCSEEFYNGGEIPIPAGAAVLNREISAQVQNGGIEEDVEEEYPRHEEHYKVDEVLDALQHEGCSGGRSTVFGNIESLITTLGHRTNYSLVVIGDLFIAKSNAVRTRLTSELRSLLADSIKAPVVEADELEQELKFSIKDFIRLSAYLAIAAILFLAVILNQDLVLRLLADEAYQGYRILVILAILVFVPVFAFAYGTSAHQILRFFRLD